MVTAFHILLCNSCKDSIFIGELDSCWDLTAESIFVWLWIFLDGGIIDIVIAHTLFFLSYFFLFFDIRHDAFLIVMLFMFRNLFVFVFFWGGGETCGLGIPIEEQVSKDCHESFFVFLNFGLVCVD